MSNNSNIKTMKKSKLRIRTIDFCNQLITNNLKVVYYDSDFECDYTLSDFHIEKFMENLGYKYIQIIDVKYKYNYKNVKPINNYSYVYFNKNIIRFEKINKIKTKK